MRVCVLSSVYVGSGQPIPHGGTYHQAGDPFRPVYPTRMFPPAAPPAPPTQAAAPYMYTSPPRMLSFHSQYPAASAAAVSDYFVGHVLSNPGYGGEGNNYTCIGAPVGHSGGGGGGGGVRDVSLQNQEEGVGWGRR